MEALHRVIEEAFDLFAPPPELTVTQWAEQSMRLSANDSAEPGRYNADRAPYQRGILDAVSDELTSDVVVMSSAQVGKTTLLKAIIGYYIDQEPSPILVVMPTVDLAKAFSRDRLDPMLKDSPALRDKIAEPKSRGAGNTILHKQYLAGNGSITIGGSNSPPSLSSRNIRVCLMDEVDRFPASVGTEGDPVSLARKRTQTFDNRKVLMTSTPTEKGLSRIESAFNESDRRFFHVPCPHCGHRQRLTWEAVTWPDGKPEAASIACVECGATWSEPERQRAVLLGEWVATQPFKGTAGFHLSELYSPWSSPGAMAEAFEAANRADQERMKAWVNTALGEPFEEKGEEVDADVLLARCEEWGDLVPPDVRVLTMGCDVQANRIEAEVVGHVGHGEGVSPETYSIDYIIHPGDTSMQETWDGFADYVNARYPQAGGGELSISLTLIDSGYRPTKVYRFCLAMGAHVIAAKGMRGARPIVESQLERLKRLRKRIREGHNKPELIGVDEAKVVAMRRLKVSAPGPGFCHFPKDRDKEYFLQLTAERLISRTVGGVPVQEWKQTRARNEALDCRVLNIAALEMLGDEVLEAPDMDPDPPNLPKRVGGL